MPQTPFEYFIVIQCQQQTSHLQCITGIAFFCRISISNGPSLALVDIVQKKLITVLSAQDMSGKGHFINDLSLTSEMWMISL